MVAMRSAVVSAVALLVLEAGGCREHNPAYRGPRPADADLVDGEPARDAPAPPDRAAVLDAIADVSPAVADASTLDAGARDGASVAGSSITGTIQGVSF